MLTYWHDCKIRKEEIDEYKKSDQFFMRKEEEERKRREIASKARRMA